MTDPDRDVGAARPSVVVPRLAATIVLLRAGPAGPEVLLTHRPSTMAFGPGLHVFPGGALDPGNEDQRLLGRLREPASSAASPTHGGAVAVAAIRELYEEAGVLLASPRDGRSAGTVVDMAPGPPGASFADLAEARDLVLRGDWLVPLSRWVTPPGLARRFDARFFVAAMPRGAEVAPDPREVAAHAWMTPRDALAEMAAGRMELWPPTSTTLQQLAHARDFDDVRRHLAPVGGAARPSIERLSAAVVRLRFGGAGGIGGQTVDGYLVGERRVLVVDPGDPSDEAAEAVMSAAEASGARVTGILLTSPAPDHAAGVEGISQRLGLPILASAGARSVLTSVIVPLVDGEAIELADIPIVVRATPGIHPDHLAFEARPAGVVLVGDLVGPGPSRAIPEPVDADALASSRALVSATGLTPLAAHPPSPG